MAVIPVDPHRFDSSASASESAEKQRVASLRKCIASARPAQPDNLDLLDHPDGRASFTKGLVHDPVSGLVQPAAFAALREALGRPREEAFAAIEGLEPHTGALGATRPWVNPIAGRAFATAGGDPQQYALPPPPKFGSNLLSFELLESYWMALLRDVAFSHYDSHPLAARAASELSAFHKAAQANGPGSRATAVDATGRVTPRLLFRGLGPGESDGPYVSQFLLHPVPFGVQGFGQRNRTLVPGLDFVTSWMDWHAVQNGARRDLVPSHYDARLRYVRNGRDLAQWVHIDVPFQACFNAGMIMLHGGAAPSSAGGGIGAPRSEFSPYAGARRQEPYATLGAQGHVALMCEAAGHALRAAWYQKWYVHLRLRPEAYAARVHYELGHAGAFGLPADLLGSDAVGAVLQRYGTALLPLAYPEGSPMHPSYGAAQATVAGACVTLLKATFDVSGAFPNPVDVAVDAHGDERLVPCGGALTLEGELNKLASNVALGRNIAGVHWRSDVTASLRLGEEVAIDLLGAYARSCAEAAPGAPVFGFRRFDGTLKTVTA